MLICELLKGLPDEVVKVLTQDLATLRYFAEACGHENPNLLDGGLAVLVDPINEKLVSEDGC